MCLSSLDSNGNGNDSSEQNTLELNVVRVILIQPLKRSQDDAAFKETASYDNFFIERLISLLGT